MKTTPEAKKKILNAFSLLCSIALLAVSAPVCTAAGEKNNAEGTLLPPVIIKQSPIMHIKSNLKKSRKAEAPYK